MTIAVDLGRKATKQTNKPFRCGILGQVWYLIVSIPDLCQLSYFELAKQKENVRDKFCKSILKVPIHTSNILARGDGGRFPFCFIYFTLCIKYWLNLTRMEAYRYLKQCYLILKYLDDCNRTTWATKVRNLLCRYGFEYVWLA